MGRPRTATNILEMRGAFKRHPERKRTREPVAAAPFPKSAPRHLTDDRRKAWREIVKAVPAGVLTASDVFAVELAACLMAELRRDPDVMPAARLARYHAALAMLGLNPSARSALVVPNEPADGGEFDDV